MNEKLKHLWAAKTKDDEWWSSFITAPLGIVINYFIIDIARITPNRITAASFIVAVVAAVFIVSGGTVSFIIAAILIHLSHILDCMDGQMARYRKTSSLVGCFYDKLTDQIQVTLWFAAVGYAAYSSSQNVLPIFLAFFGVAFYNIRGYVKYVSLYTGMSIDNQYLEKLASNTPDSTNKIRAGLGCGFLANFQWLIREQRKICFFDEGVFIFMLSLALVINQLTPMLWIFAISQIYYGLMRAWQRGRKVGSDHLTEIKK